MVVNTCTLILKPCVESVTDLSLPITISELIRNRIGILKALKKKMKLIPVNIVEEVDGKLTYNMSATLAGDDWIRAARALKAGQTAKLKRMEETQMCKLVLEEGDEEFEGIGI